MAAIEQERGLPAGTIDHILKDNNLPRATFAQQVKAQMAWHKLLLKKIKPQVKISDEEIRLGSKRAMLPPPPKASSVPQEWQIAVIALPVDKASREMQMRQLGEKLVKEIRGGASFEEVSRQFSSSAASNGGKTESFWVRSGQLDPSVAQALAAAKEGMVTDPVRTAAGYTIVKLYKTRSIGKAPEPEAADDNKDMQVSLKEILLKLKPGAKEKEASVLLQIGEDVAKHPGSCKEKGVAGIDNLDDYNIEVNFQTALLSELPPAIRIIADNLKVGDISTPFASDAGIRLFMLCGKKDPANAPPDKERVYGMLLQEKMLLEAQKYLRNLRRDSFIEVRKE
jgi:peptidyl-prolyl cis-trans isomerase SurA